MAYEQIINLDKPAGISSARAVAMIKRLLPRGTKVGHAGTLDPFATGVLLILVGKATKRCEELMGMEKVYETTLKLGATTATLDPESPEIIRTVAQIPTLTQIENFLGPMRGLVWQRPPSFSAMKVAGQRAYHLARQGKMVELPPRQVRIDEIKILRYEWPILELCISSGRGTYIRAIAGDLGEALGVGSYLTTLRRTRIGEFDVKTATPLSAIQKIFPVRDETT